jgi:DNA-binding NarL/FixJ family response regulator
LLVDDYPTAREPLAAVLRGELGVAVIQAGSAAEARRALAGAPIDLAVVELDLPDGDGLALISEILVTHAGAGVLALGASPDRGMVARATEAGAAGVVSKSAPVRDLVAALGRLRAGERLLTPWETIELLRLAIEERTRVRETERLLARLTPREREVLQALADGLSDKEIAERLHVSPKTVRFHMVNVLAKLGVDSRLQALLVAARHGIVDLR